MNEPFDESAKGFLRQWFETRGIAVEVEFAVFPRERTIDLLIRCRARDLQRLRETVFAHFRRLNDVELKGEGDPLTLEDYNTILARAWAVGGRSSGKAESPRLSGGVGPLDDTDRLPSSRTVTLVCVTRPQRLLEELNREMGIQPTERPGVYHRADQQGIWIIHPNELELKPANYPLLPLTTGPQRDAFVEICTQEGLIDHLQLTLDIAKGDLAPAEILQRVMGLEKKMPMTREVFEIWDQYIRSRPHMKEEFIDSPQRETLRRMLMRLLRRKFVEVPDEIVAYIGATDDMDQLEAWMERFVDAETLDEVGILPSEPE